MILYVLPVAVPAAVSPTAPSSNYLDEIQNQIRSRVSSLDTVKAIGLAAQSSVFQSMSRGYGYTFNSIFNTWSYSFNPDGSVAVAWKDVDVVYSLRNANGSTTNFVVKEDPNLSSVINVTVQKDVAQPSPVDGSSSTAIQVPFTDTSSQAALGGETSTQAGIQPIVCGPGGPQCTVGESATVARTNLAAPVAPSTPDFSMSASQTQMSFTAGGSGTSTITLGSLNGFVGTIALVPSISPSTGQIPAYPLNVTSITLTSGASGSSTLSVSTSVSTVAQTYTITLTAVSGTLIHSVSVTVNVQADILLSAATPSPSSFVAGNPPTSSSGISLQSLGLTGSVTLSASASPSLSNGPGLSFNPSTFSMTPGSSASSTLSISTTASTQSNTYVITITATGPGVARSVSVTVNVLADFQISASNPPNLAGGNSGTTSGTSTITLSSIGLSGSITLSANPPGGISTSFGTNPVSMSPGSSGSSVMTISVGSVASGTYTITVTGTSGSLSHSVNVNVNVCNNGVTSSSVFAGYTFRLACNYPGSITVTNAVGTWSVPSVNQPPNSCSNTHCDLTVAVGLEHLDGGSDGYQVVAGSDSGLYCTIFGCSWYYHAIYDLYPSASVQCSITVNPGDSLFSQVQYVNGAYNLFIDNNSNGQACSANGQTTAMGTPYFGVYGGFRPIVGGSTARLPQFGTVRIASCTVGPSQCLTEYNQGFSVRYDMWSGGNHDVSVGLMASDNSFSFSWLTSSGT